MAVRLSATSLARMGDRTTGKAREQRANESSHAAGGRPERSTATVGPHLLLPLLLALAAGICLARGQQQIIRGQFQTHIQHANGTPSSASLITTSQQQQQPMATTQKPNYLETGRQITGILDRFMSLGYDKRVRPNYGGPPVEVNVTMRILSISSVSEVMMDFTADFYFRQTWHDPRLSFKKLGDIQTLYVGAEVSKKIWLPDTFFGNEKMAYFHEATTPNVFLRIDHSGEVYRSIRLTVTSSCPMNLQYFPMDRQRCTIEAESYGYNVKDIIYRWARKDTAVERDKEISLPQFDIVQTVQKYRLEELSSGTYSRLIAEIHFARRMGYYLIQIYIPSSLIVVISWVSFWLHRNASPARVQLGVTTVLTMTTLMSSTNAALPKISYVKSIDIFLGTCFVMVFAALLEYATVGYLGKRIAMRKAHAQHAQSQAQAKLFAQLQAQGAQGDSVPLSEAEAAAAAAAAAVAASASSIQSSAPGQTTGNLGIFGNSTEQTTQIPPPSGPHSQHNNLLSGPNTPLGVLLSDPNLLSAMAAAAAAAAAGNSTASDQSANQQQHHHQRGRPCSQVATAPSNGGESATGQCTCAPAPATHQSQHGACQHHHHAHNQQQYARINANCPHHAPPSQANNHCHRACNHNNNQYNGASKVICEPQAPPRRNPPQKLAVSVSQQQQQAHKHCSCECQSNNGTAGSGATWKGSQTLPRNLTFAHQQPPQHFHHPSAMAPATDYHSPSSQHSGVRGICCDAQQQQHNSQQQPPFYSCNTPVNVTNASQLLSTNQFNSATIGGIGGTVGLQRQASPSKGAASAAAAAAATFVNLHRKNKGLPPSTNPNFAQFATPLVGPHNRHLETIFGIRPSDIDKYSRVVFPVCFVCFQLMYWIVYLHISAFLEPDQQQQLQPPTLPQPTVAT